MSIRSTPKVLAVAWNTTADTCTVQSSTRGSIPEGTVARYSGPVFTNVQRSTVILVTPNGATASGHCSLSPTGLGTCRFSKGTGSLTGFHALLKVTNAPDGVVSWEGTYYFGPTA